MDDRPAAKGASGIARIVKAAGYSFDGLRAVYRHEAAFRQEVWLALVLVPLALICNVSATSKALMIASVLLVLVVEILNSAIEAIVDKASPEHHPLAKRAKDAGSAAVMVALLNLAVVWGLVLLG